MLSEKKRRALVPPWSASSGEKTAGADEGREVCREMPGGEILGGVMKARLEDGGCTPDTSQNYYERRNSW